MFHGLCRQAGRNWRHISPIVASATGHTVRASHGNLAEIASSLHTSPKAAHLGSSTLVTPKARALLLRTLPAASVACNDQDAAQTRPGTATLVLLGAVLAASRISECAPGSDDDAEASDDAEPAPKKRKTLTDWWPRRTAAASTPPANTTTNTTPAVPPIELPPANSASSSAAAGCSSAAQVLEPASLWEPSCVVYEALSEEDQQHIDTDYREPTHWATPQQRAEEKERYESQQLALKHRRWLLSAATHHKNNYNGCRDWLMCAPEGLYCVLCKNAVAGAEQRNRHSRQGIWTDHPALRTRYTARPAIDEHTQSFVH